MDFNKLVLDKLGLIFQANNLQITEQFNNYIKLESENIIMTIGYVEQEKSCFLFAGGKEMTLYTIDDNILREVFKTAIKINNVTIEIFLNNLEIFFENEGISMIKGDVAILRAIQRCVYKESREYTSQLLDRQNITF